MEPVATPRLFDIHQGQAWPWRRASRPQKERPMSPALYLIVAMFAFFILVLGYVAAQDWLHARKTKRSAR